MNWRLHSPRQGKGMKGGISGPQVLVCNKAASRLGGVGGGHGTTRASAKEAKEWPQEAVSVSVPRRQYHWLTDFSRRQIVVVHVGKRIEADRRDEVVDVNPFSLIFVSWVNSLR